MLELIFYIISIIFILIPITKIIIYHIYNDSIIFSFASTTLLIFSTLYFYIYFQNYYFSLLSTILLIIFTILLLKDIKSLLGYIPLTSYTLELTNIYILINICLNYL